MSEKQTKSAPAGGAAWAVLIVAWVAFLVPVPGLGILGMILNVVAFVLAVVAMAQGGAFRGLPQLLLTLTISPLLYFVGWGVLAAAVKNGVESTQASAPSAAIAEGPRASSAAPAPSAAQVNRPSGASLGITDSTMSWEVLDLPAVKSALVAKMGVDGFARFKDYFTVGGPVIREGRYWVGLGAKAHFAGSTFGGVAIDSLSRQVDYFWVDLDAKDGGASGPVGTLPEPLRTAISEHLDPADVMAAAAKTYQTSFDCAAAKSVPERLICSDEELAAADLRLQKAFKRARAATADPAAFKSETRAAWNRRERECSNRECLLAWYREREDAYRPDPGPR